MNNLNNILNNFKLSIVLILEYEFFRYLHAIDL